MDHEKLFDEIVGKLNQLSHRSDANSSQERLQRAQSTLQKAQHELRVTETDLNQRLGAVETQGLAQLELGQEVRKLSEQLEHERGNSNKLASELARSLELNLKLQFEIEEVRSRVTQTLNEEKKHNQYLTEKNRGLGREIELAEALTKDTKGELQKAKEKIQSLMDELVRAQDQINQRDNLLGQLQREMEMRLDETQNLTTSLEQFEAHTVSQNDVLKKLSEAAEKKMIELKMALDKKAFECQDYYGHLQQSLAQASILRQENAALKDYISKMSTLAPQTQNPAQTQNSTHSHQGAAATV